MARSLKVQCAIAGGGPAGMMLGYLLGRAGVSCLVLEKHADFLRDFRGDTVHPSTLRILSELGLLDEFLRIPHAELRELKAEIGHESFKVVDFSRLDPPGSFIAIMPQWDFLNFLVRKGQQFPALSVRMSTEVTGLIEDGGRVCGLRARDADGELTVLSDLVVGCDGRSSTVRSASALPLQDLGAPIDVLWFRLSKKPTDPPEILGHLDSDRMIVTIDRSDYWQCAYVIGKGRFDAIRNAGIDAFRAQVADGARFLADRTAELRSFDDVKLLSVSVNRLTHWSKPGLLCIGDAAHAMSPVGGVGINLAVQDAVATANLLAEKLRSARLSDGDLDAVRQRRARPMQVIQMLQVAIHNRVLKPAVSGERHELSPPLAVRVLDHVPWLRRWPAQLLGLGLRPERVESALREHEA